MMYFTLTASETIKINIRYNNLYVYGTAPIVMPSGESVFDIEDISNPYIRECLKIAGIRTPGIDIDIRIQPILPIPKFPTDLLGGTYVLEVFLQALFEWKSQSRHQVGQEALAVGREVYNKYKI